MGIELQQNEFATEDELWWKIVSGMGCSLLKDHSYLSLPKMEGDTGTAWGEGGGSTARPYADGLSKYSDHLRKHIIENVDMDQEGILD